MKNFQFKYQPVRKVKELFEKKAQKELNLIRLELEEKEKELNVISKERLESNGKIKNKLKASELLLYKEYQNSLDESMRKIKQHISFLVQKKENKLLELQLKSKEHKVFEKLEEIMSEEFTRDQEKAELKQINEIAIRKFQKRSH